MVVKEYTLEIRDINVIQTLKTLGAFIKKQHPLGSGRYVVEISIENLDENALRSVDGVIDVKTPK